MIRSLLAGMSLCLITTVSQSAQLSATNEPQPQAANLQSERYDGYAFNLTKVADRQDYAAIVDALRRQVDIVERSGLSERVLQAFRQVPILVDDLACLDSMADHADDKTADRACYGPFPTDTFQAKSLSYWYLWENDEPRSVSPLDTKVTNALQQDSIDLAKSERLARGIIMVRPRTLILKDSAQVPILLREFLRFYHYCVLPQGDQYAPIAAHYEAAKSKHLYSEYVLSSPTAFFAVTASIFLNDTDHEQSQNRLALKKVQPDYYNFLVRLFGFDPPPSTAPVASAN
jgi:hypothetical protein